MRTHPFTTLGFAIVMLHLVLSSFWLVLEGVSAPGEPSPARALLADVLEVSGRIVFFPYVLLSVIGIDVFDSPRHSYRRGEFAALVIGASFFAFPYLGYLLDRAGKRRTERRQGPQRQGNARNP